MLNFSISRRRQNQQRPATAGQRLDRGLDRGDQRPKVRKAGAFEFIFKETIGGIEVMHSRSDHAFYLNRNSALGATEPALKRWLHKWAKLGGVALL